MGGEGTPGSPGVMHGEALHPPISERAAAGLEVLTNRIGEDAALSLGSVQVGPGGKCMGTIAELTMIPEHADMAEGIVTGYQNALDRGLSPQAAEAHVFEVLDSHPMIGKVVHRDETGAPDRVDYGQPQVKKN